MGEPPKKSTRRQRRPTLRDALNAAHSSGQKVKGAVVEPDGKITLTFGEPTAVDGTNENEWDRRERELARGKH